MKSCYLFSNFDYGNRFLKAFEQSAIKRPQTNHIVVLSPSRKEPSDWLHTLRTNITTHYKAFKLTPHCVVKICSQVNSADFIGSVPEHSCGFIAGFNQIFKNELITKFENILNFHPSILPFYRGAIPSYWAIKNGEKRTGFTLHVVTKHIDAGEILHQEYVDIPFNSTEEHLDSLISVAGARYLKVYLDAIFANHELPKKQLGSPYLVSADYLPPTRMEVD